MMHVPCHDYSAHIAVFCPRKSLRFLLKAPPAHPVRIPPGGRGEGIQFSFTGQKASLHPRQYKKIIDSAEA